MGLEGDLPPGFPVIDDWDGKTATSIKSTDLRAKTYQDNSKLRNKLNGYIRSVANYTGKSRGTIKIDPADINIVRSWSRYR